MRDESREGQTAAMTREQEVRELVTRVVDAHIGASRPGESQAPEAAPGAEGGDRGANPSQGVTIAIGADHGGFVLKQHLSERLKKEGYTVQDCGTHTPEAVDYPDYAHAVAARVGSGICAWGIVVDGAGIGSCMVANKVPGVRAALCHDVSSAHNSREHNHANVLTLGARFIGEGLADEIVSTWLATPWGPGRHAARVGKIDEIEHRYLRATTERDAHGREAAR